MYSDFWKNIVKIEGVFEIVLFLIFWFDGLVYIIGIYFVMCGNSEIPYCSREGILECTSGFCVYVCVAISILSLNM